MRVILDSGVLYYRAFGRLVSIVAIADNPDEANLVMEAARTMPNGFDLGVIKVFEDAGKELVLMADCADLGVDKEELE